MARAATLPGLTLGPQLPMMKVSARKRLLRRTRLVPAAAVKSGTHENCLSGLLFGDQRRHVSGCARFGRSSGGAAAGNGSRPGHRSLAGYPCRRPQRNLRDQGRRARRWPEGNAAGRFREAAGRSARARTTSTLIRRNTITSTSIITNTRTSTRTLIIPTVG